MIETKYIPAANAKALFDLLTIAKNNYDGELWFKVYDTESHVINTRHPEKVIAEMDGGDEEFGIYFYDREKDIKVGWIGILPYEEDGIPYDYSETEFNKKIEKIYTENQ